MPIFCETRVIILRMSLFEQDISRRALLNGLCLSGALGLLGGLPACMLWPTPALYQGPGLRDFAAARRFHIGAALSSHHLQNRPYATAVAKQLNMLVPENELKWKHTQPQPGVFDFSGYNQLAAFATAHSMAVRGHTLVWHTGMPEWAKDALETGTKRDATEMMTSHIHAMLAHTAPLIKDWDVVNEAIDPNSTRPDFLRENTLWMHALGEDYVMQAYKLAHAANPKLTLTYNDYSLEYADGASIRRRAGVLHLLRRLKQAGLPVKQLGLQSHLACHRPLGGKAFTDFLRQVRALGIKVIVTELDLKLEKVPGTDAERLAAGAHYASVYLKMLQQDAPLDTVLCWGLSSPYSFMTLKDPSTLDPLPLDGDMNPLPLWNTLRDAWLVKQA